MLTGALSSANALLREAFSGRQAVFGWHRMTLAQYAALLALPRLAAEGLAPASPLALEALSARVVFELEQRAQLGRFREVAHRPGLARALSRTLLELQLAGVAPQALPDSCEDLRRFMLAFEATAKDRGIAGRAQLLEAATQVAVQGAHPLLGLPTLSLDVALRSPLEARFLAALLERHPESVAWIPAGDEQARELLQAAGVSVEPSATQGVGAAGGAARPPSASALTRLQERLFQPAAATDVDASGVEGTDEDELTSEVPAERDTSVRFLGAPGESRECVEILRRVLEWAKEGVPFERMAILLRSPEAYHAHLREAFLRAEVPAHFTRGARRPEPGGRALLALLDCAADGLSARSFAEYLSLGVVPADTTADGESEGDVASPSGLNRTSGASGTDPRALPGAFVPPDNEYLSASLASPHQAHDPDDPDDPDDLDDLDEHDDPAAPEGQGLASPLRARRAPRLWESLLVESAVLGGHERWGRRLAGLRAELELRRAHLLEDDPHSPAALHLTRRLESLESLTAFALPLLEELSGLPESATWAQWLDALHHISLRALREPAPVQRALAELEPMGEVGPVSLAEVRLVLAERLGELRDAPSTVTAGKVFVGTPDDARGHSFEVVFVPGLAEKLFPKKVLEDPILRDDVRLELHPGLATLRSRVASERLALRLAVGAAESCVTLSWPRVDAERGRPRVPSFYGLEVVRAAEGQLPDFQTLEARAERGAASRLGWPAPASPQDAIDESEYDLATLAQSLAGDATRGAARYLLESNPHLGRALRARARRQSLKRFTPDDGLVEPMALAAEALRGHRLKERAYSATALERYARCPYQFFLHSVMRLSVRETPEPVEGMDPLTRGSFIHEAQFRVLRALREGGDLPLRDTAALQRAQTQVGKVFVDVDREYREQLAPAIEDVWAAHGERILVDLLDWVARLYDEPEPGGPFVPTHFELAFGLPNVGDHDRASRAEALPLTQLHPQHLNLRGSIDLVEARGKVLRATDYKTGRNRIRGRLRVGGGMTLQPALYAMALEALFPEHEVQGGRLYFCTSRGEFTSREVPLDETTRKGVRDVLQAVDGALEDGFLPPVPLVEPTHTACDHCDYRPICGPAEAKRVTPKVRRATSSHPTRARGDDAQAAHGQRLIELELLRRRE